MRIRPSHKLLLTCDFFPYAADDFLERGPGRKPLTAVLGHSCQWQAAIVSKPFLERETHIVKHNQSLKH